MPKRPTPPLQHIASDDEIRVAIERSREIADRFQKLADGLETIAKYGLQRRGLDEAFDEIERTWAVLHRKRPGGQSVDQMRLCDAFHDAMALYGDPPSHRSHLAARVAHFFSQLRGSSPAIAGSLDEKFVESCLESVLLHGASKWDAIFALSCVAGLQENKPDSIRGAYRKWRRT